MEAALCGFEALPAEQATGAEVVALVQEDRLVARSEEAVFQWVKRWWEAGARPEAELLAVLRHVRFAAMAEAFLRETVRAWPALGSAEAKEVLWNAVLPFVGNARPVPRSGFGPRLIYVVGGEGEDGEEISSVELYDPQAASWGTQRAGMTVARYAHGCVALDGKLYAVGGERANNEEVDTAEVKKYEVMNCQTEHPLNYPLHRLLLRCRLAQATSEKQFTTFPFSGGCNTTRSPSTTRRGP